jgi:hypothetical protein
VLKKKNQQQAALVQHQNLSQGSQAGPKPFPLPLFPVINDSFLNGINLPSNINISTIKPEAAEVPDAIAPLEKSSKKPSDIERVAPFQ